MRLRDDEKKWVDQALNDVEKAFWIIQYTLDTRLPTKMSGGMRTESFVEKELDHKNMTDQDYIALGIAKEDYRNFHTRAMYDANRLISDAMQQFYCIAKGLKLEYQDDSDIYLEAKEEVATRWDKYLQSWWPSKSSNPNSGRNSWFHRSEKE